MNGELSAISSQPSAGEESHLAVPILPKIETATEGHYKVSELKAES
jgi:hypothetical protein